MTARAPRTEDELDDLLSDPGDAVVSALAAIPGDIIVLGAGGKMGPTLATMAVRAGRKGVASGRRRVFAVSTFSSGRSERVIGDGGAEPIRCDLLDCTAVHRLPDAPNVIYMAGQKFGTRDVPPRTWMMNVVAPAICAERYARSTTVVFSTGNVYPLVPTNSNGAQETDGVGPVGEYASSCLGRERVFEHFAATAGSKVAFLRLNYAIDLRYGVLTDLATAIMTSRPIPVAMGYVNVIWQRDASRAALALLGHATTPPTVVNVTGSEKLSVRDLAKRLGQRLGRRPIFQGTEAEDALLSDASRMRSLVGAPEMPIETMLDWVADWVGGGRVLLGKPTHFESRDGSF